MIAQLVKQSCKTTIYVGPQANSQIRAPKHCKICDISRVQRVALKKGPWSLSLFMLYQKKAHILHMLYRNFIC